MKCTQRDDHLKSALQKIGHEYPNVADIAQKIFEQKGRAILVGGAVRDIIMHCAVKDLDIEVYGLSMQSLEALLAVYGPVSLVGKSFGVLRVHGIDVDWSLPRADSSGRKPEVMIDPHMNIQDACARRDLTMNAMGLDLISGELIDPYNGLEDIKNKILRSPDISKFAEDPLRFYRVMQFIGRFEMYPDTALEAECKRIDISSVSKERIEEEFEKLLRKSKCPSLGFRWMRQIGRLQEILPELYALIGVEQEPSWHPEGDVFEHTMQALDAAAGIARMYTDRKQQLILLYAALCHDLGKAVATTTKNGKIISYGHEKEGVSLARTMMKRITAQKDMIDAILLLVRHHMDPGQFIKNNAGIAAYKRLALKLAPHVSLALLADLARADKRGRNPKGREPLTNAIDEADQFIAKAAKARVVHNPEEAVLHGRDIIDSVAPGPAMGKLLARAYEIQIEEGITDKDELKKRIVHNKKVDK